MVGRGSKLGINRTWKHLSDGAIDDQGENALDIQWYMEVRNWIYGRNHATLLPHPQDHLGARLLGHYRQFRTITQFSGALLALWRVRNDNDWQILDEGWRWPEDDPRRDTLNAFLSRIVSFNQTESIQWHIYIFASYRAATTEETRNDTMLKLGRLGSSALCQKLVTYTDNVFNEIAWEEPQDDEELLIAQAGLLWFLKVRAESDKDLQLLIRRMIKSGKPIVYYDHALPGHETTLSSGTNSECSSSEDADVANVADDVDETDDADNEIADDETPVSLDYADTFTEFAEDVRI